MIYLTGDTHGSYSRIVNFCNQIPSLSFDDVMIVMGDTGLNYYGDERDEKKKKKVSAKLPLTMFFIHGNHDLRPIHISTYKQKIWRGGTVYYEDEFPNLLFAKDGEIFDFDDRKAIVIGGAYSIDKQYRLDNGYKWFEDEQPSTEIKAYTEQQLQKLGMKIDTVLSHTCPLKYEPTEAFFKSVNQNTVDKSTENWLDSLENKLDYAHWYCGHYHIDKTIDRLRFLYKDIVSYEDRK